MAEKKLDEKDLERITGGTSHADVLDEQGSGGELAEGQGGKGPAENVEQGAVNPSPIGGRINLSKDTEG